ncbi:hypothetical protein SCHPADRAFT_126728 [Schizopora paradoxa]|uniref:Uncharacterized protein n=1 Tax=Schizopora paradoxa TaxID=27342 RepID=A0A0H2SMD1_9AGAM|nr:hypothetical protein SCHPADRAFT_126728 [Schizopora paradoxa]
MRFSSRGLKTASRRGTGSPLDSTILVEGGSKPPSERRKKTKMKSAKRTASAVASHSFDVVREISDVFGPLKSVVNGVGHAANVMQNARRSQKDARMLRAEVDAFRSQVDGIIPDVSLTPLPVVDSLVRLDRYVPNLQNTRRVKNCFFASCFRELDDIEASTILLSKDRFGSRILHWKERESLLRTAELRFRGARERFSIDCSIAATVLSHTRQQTESIALGVQFTEERMKFGQTLWLEGTLKVLALVGLFGSNGSMADPTLNRKLHVLPEP